GRLALDQQREAFDVASLALGLREGGRARGLRGLLSFREAFLQEQADRRARMRQGQPGSERGGRAEALEGLSIPGQESVDRAIVGFDRRRRIGADRKTVGVVAHAWHASQQTEPPGAAAPAPVTSGARKSTTRRSAHE